MMQIKRLDIAGFGKFQQRQFTFGDGLQVIYGLNESGKSTLRAFILGMLFGFPSRRHPLERYEPQGTSQYGGSIDLLVDGTTYRLTRLGEQPATLTNLTTQEVQPMALLEKWLAPYDRDQYLRLFTFNQAELTALKTLRASDLNVQLQQVGLVGSAPWRETAATLRADAEALYKPRGRKPELNQALQRYHLLNEQVNTAKQRYPEYEGLQNQLAALQTQQAQVNRQLSDLEHQQQQLANLRNQWPVYQQLTALQTSQPTTTLDAATVATYRKLSQQRTDLQHTLASARQQLSQQPVDTQSQGLVGFYVQHQAQFDQLSAQLPTLQQAVGQYQALTQQAATAKADFQAQSNAHPELLGCLSPHKQAAIATLKATLAATANTRTQRTPSPSTSSLDWRLIAGGVAVVAGIGLPLGGFKWVLMLIGVGLLGWFGLEHASSSAQTSGQTAADQLSEQLVAAGLAPDLTASDALQQLDLVGSLQRAQAAVTNADQALAAQATKLWHDIQAYQFARDWLPVDEQHLAESVTRIADFYDHVHQVMQQQTMAGPDFAFAQRQVQQLTTQVRAVTEQLQQLATTHGLADIDALTQAVADQETQAANATSAQQLAQQLSAAELAALQQYASLDDLQAAILKLRQQRSQIDQQQTQLAADIVTAQTQLQHLTEDGRYATLRQQEANLQTEITVMARQWLTRQLGANWIDASLEALTQQQLPTVLAAATTIFAQLTAQRYNKIDLDGDEMVVKTSDTSFMVAALSTATKEQLYLALRLALIDHLAEQAQLPLMIDDGFVNFDDQRKRAAWQTLATVARQHQVLYFTNETAALTQLPTATVQQLT
ncbi:ATP-binding protein [Lactiplantibacillus pentosus]|uniref:ATP-binding protein n=1 Tax=Lactiplantibacillus pentosus TaxID=1589 RepID=UPI00259AF475|nr:AAA family ATPase [Lactiplantibacillus pentosus]WFC04441.1 AAA family ATPase [Lactiplantibacillus pentosus]